MKHLTLREARAKSGRPAREIAEEAGCDRATLYRIESGGILPARELARRLFRVYKGRVPLAAIYDPEFSTQIRAA